METVSGLALWIVFFCGMALIAYIAATAGMASRTRRRRSPLGSQLATCPHCHVWFRKGGLSARAAHSRFCSTACQKQAYAIVRRGRDIAAEDARDAEIARERLKEIPRVSTADLRAQLDEIEADPPSSVDANTRGEVWEGD